MTETIIIRDDNMDRNEVISAAVRGLEAKGYRFVTVSARGDNKGMVLSKHRTRDLAERAAKGRDRRIVCLADVF